MKNAFKQRLACSLLAASALAPAWAAEAADKVLIIVSSAGRDQGKTRPGFEMDEFSQSWLMLRANGLAEVRRADGQPLVAGRRMTGFSNEEEAAFGKQWAAQFPWLLEDRLKAQGAR